MGRFKNIRIGAGKKPHGSQDGVEFLEKGREFAATKGRAHLIGVGGEPFFQLGFKMGPGLQAEKRIQSKAFIHEQRLV